MGKVKNEVEKTSKGNSEVVTEDLKEIKGENETMKETNSKVKLNVATLSKVQKEVGYNAKTVAKYPYINEEGEVVYEIHRMQNAEQPFYTVRPLGNGEFKTGLGKVKTIPYNLPNLLKSKEDGDVIFVTEGESKADVFNKLGYVATTVPFKGTDKWTSKYNKYLKYANVLIVADNDDNARAFAENTFEEISDVANKVGILELTSIYSDLKEGGDIEDLRNIVNDDQQLKEVLDSIIENFMTDKEVD